MKTNILIFRTSITKKQDIKQVGHVLNKYPQISQWSVDLEDWEKVLRIECDGVTAEDVLYSLREIGIYATELE